MKKRKRAAQKKSVRGVSPAAGRKSMVGKIGERGRSSAWGEREGVMDGENGELTE